MLAWGYCAIPVCQIDIQYGGFAYYEYFCKVYLINVVKEKDPVIKLATGDL